MPPTVTYADGEGNTGCWKIISHNEVLDAVMVIDVTYDYAVYRPYIHGNLPVYIKGDESGDDPIAVGSRCAVMHGGIVEAPVAVSRTVGELVYFAYDDAEPSTQDKAYLTTNGADVNVVGIWGIIIPEILPIHYGEPTPASPYDLCATVRMLTEGYLNSTLYAPVAP
jgi:hypothetical protein